MIATTSTRQLRPSPQLPFETFEVLPVDNSPALHQFHPHAGQAPQKTGPNIAAGQERLATDPTGYRALLCEGIDVGHL